MINGYEANRETGPTPLRGEALGRARSSAIYQDALVAYELSRAANAYMQSLHRPQVEAMGAASIASTVSERRSMPQADVVKATSAPVETALGPETQMPPANPSEPTSPAIEEARRLVMDAFASIERQKAA